MKRSFLLIFILLLIFCFFGCSIEAKFKATVIDISENSITVTPFENEEEIKCCDTIIIYVNDKINFSENRPQKGDTVEITYGGEIAESYPAQIFDCSKIFLIG